MAGGRTFTTYMNIEPGRGNQQALSTFERQAQASLNRVANTARQASAVASAGIGGASPAKINALAAAERSRAGEIQRIVRVQNEAAVASARAAAGFVREGAAANAAAVGTTRLERSLILASAAARVAQGPLGPVAGRLTALARSLNVLSGFRLGLVVTGAAVAGFVRYAAAAQDLRAQLSAVYATQAQANAAFEDIVGIANRSRASLESVVGLYIRISQSAEQAGISQQRAARIVEIASKAATLSGGSKETQQAALVQFTQAFGANFKGSGQELQSILEGANQLAAAIAKGLGVPIGALKQLAAEGKLTTQAVADALEKASGDIDARFNRMQVTISSATTKLSTNFTKLISDTDQATGVAGGFAEVIDLLASNLHGVAEVLGTVALGYAGLKTGSIISDTRKRIAGWNDERKAILQKATTERDTYATERVGSAQRIVQLRQERAALQAQIVTEREELAARTASARAALNYVNAVNIQGPGPDARGMLLYREAVEKARVSNDNLAASKNRLKTVAGELSNETGVLTGATGRYRVAARAAETATLSFSRGVRALIATIDPLGLLLAVGINLLVQYAFREDAASSAADRMAEAQDRLGKFVDSTTGKIINQNQALVQNELLTEKKNQASALSDYQSAKSRLSIASDTGASGVPEAIVRGLSNVDPRIIQIQRQVQANKLTAAAAAKQLADLGKLNSDSEEARRHLITQLGQITTLAQTYAQATAAVGLLQGQNTGQNRRQAFGNFTGQDVDLSGVGAPGGSVSVSQLRSDAAVAAIDGGTSAIRAAGLRRDKALKDLDKEFGVTNGVIPAGKGQEYERRAEAIYATYNKVTESARAASAAAKQAVKDGRELAETTLAAGMLDLEKRKPTLTQEQYYNERQKLLKTYDDEIAKVDAAGVHVSKALQQEIRDTRQMRAEAEKAAEKRNDILGGYLGDPKAISRAKDQIDDLQKMVGTFIDDSNGQLVLYTQAQADADKAAIEYGVMKPVRDAIEEQQRGLELGRLRLAGYDNEAAALETALQLQDQIGVVNKDDLATILHNVDAQQRLNDALESRQRQVSQILSIAQDTRDAFEEMIVGLRTNPGQALKKFGNQILDNITRIEARQFTEKLFAGADAKLRELVSGAGGLDRAADILASHVQTATTVVDKLTSANDDLATATEGAAQRINAAADSIGAGGIPGLAPPSGGTPGAAGTTAGGAAPAASGDLDSQIQAALNRAHAFLGILPLVGAGTAAASAASGVTGLAAPANDNTTLGPEIVVTASRVVRTLQRQEGTGTVPSAATGYGSVFEQLGQSLDKTFKSGTFFSGIGKGVGKAFEGAAQGTMASSLLGMTGLKQSSTGAAIGGAIGSFIPIPGGSIIGGLIGGTLGGLLKGVKSGRVTIGSGSNVLGGTSSKLSAAAGQTGTDIMSQLQSIAQQLGGTVGNFGAITIGQRKGTYRVNVGGSGTGSLKHSHGAKDFGTDEASAVAYAVAQAIANGAIKGISAASKRILASGQDLQTAIMKATAIESIPRELLQMTDPVRAAVQELNDQFTQLISYLKEGGATAAQFADAQKLYDLKRADAIKQATQNASDAIQAFLDEMTGGQSSPFNKRTTYENAATKLNTFRSDIAAGKVVDQNDLLSAAKNFEDASQALYGSGSSFFADFNDLFNLLTKAKDNVTGGTGSLPGSPFDSTDVQNALNQLNSTTSDQTNVLANRLDRLIGLMGGSGSGVGSAIDALPGWRAAA